VALLSGSLVLLIERYVGTGDWEWGSGLSALVGVFATSIVVVGLLTWDRERRWRSAEADALRSLALCADLAASGWSDPKNVGQEALDPEKIAQELAKEAGVLSEASSRLDELHRGLGRGADLEFVLNLAQQHWAMELYYAEGSRSRRIDYLSILIDGHLPALVERRDDEQLFSLLVALRDCVVRAEASANHADAIIRERILVDRPLLLEPFLAARSGLGAVDPLALFGRALKYATDQVLHKELLEPEPRLEETVENLSFANRCIGAIRNEMQWVEDSLHACRQIVEILEPEIRVAASEDLKGEGLTTLRAEPRRGPP